MKEGRKESMGRYDRDVGRYLRREKGPFSLGTGGQNFLKKVFIAGDVNGTVMIAAIFFSHRFHQNTEVRHGQEANRNDKPSIMGTHINCEGPFGNLGIPCAIRGLSFIQQWLLGKRLIMAT